MDRNESLAKVARQLYNARAERDEAAKALLLYRQENEGCYRVDDSGEARHQTPCYHLQIEPDIWCENCLGSQPLWVRKKKAAVRVAVAMRGLMHLCRQEEQAQL